MSVFTPFLRLTGFSSLNDIVCLRVASIPYFLSVRPIRPLGLRIIVNSVKEYNTPEFKR